MNYHIITQDKFFNSYIEDIYELNLEKENFFLVQGNPNEDPYLTTNRKVEYLSNDKEYIIEKLQTLSPNDKLFVSWYCNTIAEAIMESKIPNPLYVYVMGGEFYANPWEWHSSWLYNEKTYNKFKKIGYIPSIKWTRRNPLHWGRIIDDFKYLNSWKKQCTLTYQNKLKQIERIDYIVLPKESIGEYNLLKELYPTLRAEHKYGLYDQNFDMASKMSTKIENDKPYKILLGNSADPTNNHVDGMMFIKKKLNDDYKLYTVLSYGSELGKMWAMDCGNNLFGDNFYPIDDYMNRQEYLEFLNRMDVVVMYHNRQQAVGNIMTSLVLGKPVFMKSSNVVYQLLKEIGVKTIYGVNEINKKKLSYYIDDAKKYRNETVKLIKKAYSKEQRLMYLKELLMK